MLRHIVDMNWLFASVDQNGGKNKGVDIKKHAS